jgi:hypothetical protein
MPERTPVVTGRCVACDSADLELVLGESVDSIRWHLVEPVHCSHCNIWLVAAILDQSGRFWGRRQIWHD